MQRTTDLQKVKEGQFTWGNVVAIHEIGEFSIIESVSRGDSKSVSFMPYVCGKDFRRSYETLDIAILAAIAWKYEGDLNSQAVKYICKMLGIGETK